MVYNYKILNLSSNDYANMAHNNANALRSIGVICEDLTLNSHVFGYTEESKVVDRKYIINHVNNYDVVQIFHSCPVILSLIEIAKFKGRLIVYHSGSRYRDEPFFYNNIFNPIVHRCITDQTEFMELGAKDIAYLAPHTDLKTVDKRKDGKLIVGHYPSNAIVKGTKDIREMLEPFKDDFEIRIDETILPHEENLKRIAECHIYIELFKPELNGKPYGCFGVTAFEATALGCVVVTNDLNTSVYENVFTRHDFLIANDKETFRQVLLVTSMLKTETFNDRFHKDFHSKHSIESTGKRILDLIK